MTNYEVQLSKDSQKFLKKTDKVTRQRILEAIYRLSINPFEYDGSIKLTGTENEYRIRIGKYRVLYEIKDGVLIIVVFSIDSRGDAYKRI